MEVYVAPAIFSNNESSLRSNVKASNVVWTEFDGNAPDWNDVNVPSYVIQSSSVSNQHVYWRLHEPITNIDTLEDINRRITYNMGADGSAWDSNQVLRPPETRNHKRDTPVGTLQVTDNVYTIETFDYLAPAPEQVEVDWEITALPDPETVLLKYAFGPEIINLLTKDKIDDRSKSLMNLAFSCAELGLTNNEIMVMLVVADDKWEKFKHRKDRMKRLAHIVTVARNKHPDKAFDEVIIRAFGFESFLDLDINIEWLIEPMLMDGGLMLLVGPSGIGKTQYSLQAIIHLALGKDFLHYKVPEPKKIAFLSLEMGHGELKIFLEAMSAVLSQEERLLLEQNLILVPHGEPWALNKPEGQGYLVQLIEQFDLDGVVIDTLGSAIQGNISSDETVQPFTEFIDKIRKKYDIFVWENHHMRKSKDGISTQDDVYGNQYILNRSTSTYALLKSKGNKIRIRNFKNRLAAREDDTFIIRDEHLNFHPESAGIDEMIENNLQGEVDSENPKAPGGMDL